ncbi:helix-turn-helix domain-containing protein [Paenibacillus sp. AD87]|uniref:helix-turn-helix domain-containing protein n=1 Tax=Paenibacillus sp. AD87 TaxID=1528787 RepID=UPI0007E2F088|nr:helix-turn-helix domain-containing protein [Paenibacillus sp. AD87]
MMTLIDNGYQKKGELAVDLTHLKTRYVVPDIYYELHGLALQHLSHKDGIPRQTLTTDLMIVVEEGEGLLICDGKINELQYGVPLVINAGHTVEIRMNEEALLSVWLIAFTLHDPERQMSPSLIETRETDTAGFRSIVQRIRAIENRRMAQDRKQRVGIHTQFQRLMSMVLKDTPEHEGEVSSEHTRANISEIITQLKGRYNEEITVDELADQARISKRRFTHWFRQLTGTNLSDYMTTLRMEHAKQLLLRGERMKEVAAMVGYRDEYYFNRRFKQMEGISPGQFILNHRKSSSNICVMSCLGHLLALGIRPAAVAKNLANEHYLSKLSTSFHKVNSVPLDPQEISYLQPEMILVGNQEEYDTLSPIAPTYIFSQNDDKPFVLLQKLGEVFGKGFEAEKVMKQYERKAQRLRSRLKGMIQSTDTFSVMEIRDDSIYVFGNYWCRGAYNLYDGLGLQAPERIQKELIDRQAYLMISEEQVASYVGDHLFLTVLDSERYQHMSSSIWWQEMPAVRQNQVYMTEYTEFAVTDPISMPYQLDAQMKLILERKMLHS